MPTANGNSIIYTQDGTPISVDDVSNYTAQKQTVSSGKTLRNIATRCFISYLIDTSKFFAEGKTMHVNRGSSVSALKIVEPLFIASAAGEAIIPGTTTYTESIEYPQGTFTQITWSGGSKSGSASGAFAGLESDLTALKVPIPAGAKFWRHFNHANPNGLPAPQINKLNQGTVGDLSFYSATSIVDHTMTGGETNSGSAWTIYPMAIVGMSDTPSVGAYGDSRMLGYLNGTGPNGGGVGGEVCPCIMDYLPFMNFGAVNETAATFVTSHTGRLWFMRYATDSYSNYGINDLNNGSQTAAQLEANLALLYALFSAYPLYCNTFPPIPGGTVAAPTVATWDGARTTVNNDMRARSGPFAITNLTVFEVANGLETAYNSGAYKTLPDGTAMTSDNIHLSVGGVAYNKSLNPIIPKQFYL